MSAYALFPPIEKASSACSTRAAFESSMSSEKSDVGTSSSSIPSKLVSLPLHALKTSVDRFVVPPMRYMCSTDEGSGDSFQNKTDNDNERGIAVKEAKFDPVRLVQAVTGGCNSRPQHQRKTTLRRRSSSENMRDSQSSILQSSPGSPKSSCDKNKHDTGSPHEEAIQFELSISFNGRTYTATRTLQCIIQLRNDLIREMRYRQQWLKMRRHQADLHDVTAPPPMMTMEPLREIVNEEGGACYSIEDIDIPEIPPMNAGEGTSSGGGFVGRGFTMLHTVLASYRPLMERWLRNVIAVVPQDSECLTNFLWEPVSSKEIQFEFAKSYGSLGSIKEMVDECALAEDSEDDCSESDDEWEG